MSNRSFAAIILATIVAFELYLYLTYHNPNVSPYSVRQNFILVIGATIVVGAIVTFSFPARDRKKDESQ